MGSVPQACADWANTMAAYRFFDNEAVDWRAILGAHTDCAMTRMATHEVVLCIQDTTELDFNGQETRGQRPLNYEAQLCTPPMPRLPRASRWGRLTRGCGHAKPRKGMAAAPASRRARLEGYERLAEMAAQLPSTQLVYVADREADKWLVNWRSNSSRLE